MGREAGLTDELDLSRAYALRDAIVEFDPAAHEMPRLNEGPETEEYLSVPGTVEGAGISVGDGLGESDHSNQPPAPRNRIDSAPVPIDAEGNVYATSVRTSSQDLANLLDVSETVEPGDVLVTDRVRLGKMRRAFESFDTGVVGVVAASPGVVLGMKSPNRKPTEPQFDKLGGELAEYEPEVTDQATQVPEAFSGVVQCKVDADYGAVWPGDLLVTSPTPGHAIRNQTPLPGTILGKALEPLQEGTGMIRVLVMLR